jgi:murein DD-endopeptidase MepM/ murein hydrolase activator NlpD
VVGVILPEVSQPHGRKETAVRTQAWPRGLVASVATGVVLLLIAAPAAADPRDDKARVDREIARTRAALEASTERVEAAALALEDANRRLPPVQQRLVDARAALADARTKARGAAATAERAAESLTTASRTLNRASTRVEQTRERIAEYAASAYRGRDIATLDALLTVGNPGDFVAGLTYLERVAHGQTEALEAGSQARSQAAAARDEETVRKQDADQARRLAQAAVRLAAEAEAEAANAEAEVLALVRQREDALRVADDEREATEARYKELLAESKRIAEAIRNRAKSGGGPVVQNGARLLMPVDGRKTSDFGMRLDPVYGVYRLHAGIDVAAGGGSRIFAAAAGEVLRAGWNGGYGNYTCLYHGRYQGKGFATCYAHQSAIGVRTGQQVRQGQVIGRVGTTGASTGNHLHFEVRLNGDPVNPLGWLPSCLC